MDQALTVDILLRGTPRRRATLLDILMETGEVHPNAVAVDDGRRSMTYGELSSAVESLRDRLHAAGVGPATGWGSGSRPARRTCMSRSWACSPPARRTCRSTPTTRTSGPTWCSARPASRRDRAGESAIVPRRRGAPRGSADRPGARRRRLDHLHLRLDRHPEGRRGHATARAAAFVDAEARLFLQDEPIGPGDRVLGRAVGRLRRLVRGDVAGLAARRLPGAGAARRWCAAAWTSGRGWSTSGITVVSTVPTLAALWPAEALDGGAAADLRRRGLPARAGRAAGGRRPRGVEHLRPDRGHGRRVRGAARPARARCASACRSTAGTWPSSTGPASGARTARSAS